MLTSGFAARPVWTLWCRPHDAQQVCPVLGCSIWTGDWTIAAAIAPASGYPSPRPAHVYHCSPSTRPTSVSDTFLSKRYAYRPSSVNVYMLWWHRHVHV